MGELVSVLTLPCKASGNAGAWSLKIVADDIAEHFESDVRIVDKPHEVRGSDAVIIFAPELISPLYVAKRFMPPFSMCCFFGGNVGDFNERNLVSPLAWMTKVPYVVHSQFHYDDTKAFVCDWFSPSKRRAMLPNLHLIHGGVPASRFVSERRNDKTRWIVPYQRIAYKQKRIDVHAKVMHETAALFSASGLTCPKPDYFIASIELGEKFIRQSEKMAERYGSKVHFDLTPYALHDAPEDRREFVDAIRGYGMFLSTADFESLGMYYLELLLSGVVGVFLDKPWVRHLLPGYPFIAERRDLPAMQLAVYNDYERASAYVHETTIPYLREHRSFEGFSKRLEAFVLGKQ